MTGKKVRGRALMGRGRRCVGALLISAVLSACTPDGSGGQSAPELARAAANPANMPVMQTFSANPPVPSIRPNEEMVQDFLELAFRTEAGQVLPVLTRFEGPVGVRVAGDVPPTLVPDLRALLARLHDEAGIDIFLTGADEAAITVEAVPRAALRAVMPDAACFAVPRVGGWHGFLEAGHGPLLDWATLARRDRAAIFVPADAAPQEIRDCLHEELAQALGPPNDLYRLPDSVFNDDNIHSVLTGFDMLILRIFHAPELRNGMSEDEVAAQLPGLFARLNPAGERQAGSLRDETPAAWTRAIETAVSPRELPETRREAAREAVGIARARGWDGPRMGHSLVVMGRLLAASEPEAAHAALTEALGLFRARPETAPHIAHAARHLAAFALARGEPAEVLALSDEAIPLAYEAQNAALLAQLLMLRAEALDRVGQHGPAARARLDSLSWARYGIGTQEDIEVQLQQIAMLNPDRRPERRDTP